MIAPLAAVCWCDRAGYGWSDVSRRSPTSAHQVTSLNTALIQAHIKPPYILIGNSLGSYHMRLYAHHFPEKVIGMVLTDGLHEKALLKMPWPLRALQLIFFSGFVISILGSALGIIRLAAALGLFKAIKPQLQQFPAAHLKPILRSFSRPKHWLTMAREIAQLNVSGHQLQVANDLGNLPIINIKARYFFKPSWLTKWLPSASIEAIRDKMHRDLMGLSTQCVQLSADKSSHFVWTDQPDVIVHAVQRLLTPA